MPLEQRIDLGGGGEVHSGFDVLSTFQWPAT
jgi:hypothetical protein